MPPSYRSRLKPAQRAVGVEAFGVLAAFAVRAVVAGEQHERVVGDAEAIERVEQPADVGVQPGDHRGLTLVGLGPVAVGVIAQIGYLRAVAGGGPCFVVGVRQRWSAQYRKNGRVAVLLDEFQRFVGDQIGAVSDFLRGDAAGRIRRSACASRHWAAARARHCARGNPDSNCGRESD